MASRLPPAWAILKRMDIVSILAELRAELTQTEAAIVSLERLTTGRGKRRGRPPAWMAAAAKQATGPKRRGRPRGAENAPKESSSE